ncbi:MAG TPA: SDR family oxidoreductase [Phycisphaerae bacterium]|jgi:nucleoside-diphosphate-sugar epimerase
MIQIPANTVAIVGCGYVGTALGAEWVRRGRDVLGTTTTPARLAELQSLGIRPALVEIADCQRLHTLLADRDAVYLTVARGKQQRGYEAVYLAGVPNLSRAVDGTPVQRVIYTSSTSVYGQNDGSWVDETSPTNPTNENGRILLATERELLDGAQRAGASAVVLRLSGIYGPGRDPAGRLERVAGQERSDGQTYVNLIHRDDIVEVMVRLLDSDFSGVMCLNNDRPILRCELYDPLLAAAGLPPIRWRGDDQNPRGKRVRNDLMKRTLGLTLAHPEYEYPAGS